MKVVINTTYGGFALSTEAQKQLNCGPYDYRYYDKRSAPELIECVESLGDRANTAYSRLKVVEIPDDIEYIILNNDGREWVAEKHRTWR